MSTNQPPPPPPVAPESLFTEEEAKVRTELYLQQRIDYQDGYYQRRKAEYTFNADRMLWFSAGLMGVSTVISSYSVMANKPFFAFLTALLPAFAAAVSAFRSLYQWQRQAQIYEGTWLALQQARLALPDTDFLQPGDYQRHFPKLVQKTEYALRTEASQWGQLQELQSPVEQFQVTIEKAQGTIKKTDS
ncbi:MAG: SLATT domain-containing protein [Anaerolineae bacterium]|nr:SLATT domain-containing protein [Anaerolineae bacterium]